MWVFQNMDTWVSAGYGRELSLNLGEEKVFDGRKWKEIINNKVKDYGLIMWKQYRYGEFGYTENVLLRK